MLSNVAYDTYTTLDAPARPEQTQPYPDRFNYSGSPIAPVDLGLPYWYSASGPKTFREVGLPAGLSMDVDTGIVTGTPNSQSVSQVDIYASNTLGESGPGEFQWTIETPPVVVTPEGAGLSLSLTLWI